jgi:hypothetical protein
MSDWDLFAWPNPNGALVCQAQAFYIYRDRAQYLDSYEEEITPNVLAQCIQPTASRVVKCPWWWPYEEDGSSSPVLPYGSRLLNVRYYVHRDGVWNVVPWADGQKLVGRRDTWDSLLSPASYTGRARFAWAAKHGVIPRGARVTIAPVKRSA